MGVFEEAVEEVDEFANDGDEGDFVGFAACGEALVEGFEDGVVADGGGGAHVEDLANVGPPALDMALFTLFSAVLIVGRDADEGGGLGAAELAELGHEGE